METLIGTTGFVVTQLAPEGQVKVNDEIWLAHSEQQAPVGETVLIKAVNALML